MEQYIILKNILYLNAKIERILVKDFGKGFYLAIDISHACDIATKNYALHGYKEKTILILGGKEYVKNYHGFRICRTIYKKQKNY